MIIHGGEPPFVEEPNPKFGGVISRLNDLAYIIQEQTANYNDTTKTKLVEFQTNLAKFINDVVIPISAHIDKQGAVHGETKTTVGLSKKDNYRTATPAEAQNLVDVDAFVTVQGANAGVNFNTPEFNASAYQQNSVLQMASYYYPDTYPTSPPPSAPGVRYLGAPGVENRATILFNSDRMVFSVPQDATHYARNSLFVSGPSRVSRKTQLEEIVNVNGQLGAFTWNGIAAKSTSGKFNFFKAIADKHLYEFTNGLAMTDTPTKSFLLYTSYGNTVYKGLAASVVVTGATTINVEHQTFRVNAFDTDPTLIGFVGNDYLADYATMSTNARAPLQQPHGYSVANFLDLPPGVTVTIATGGIPPVIGMFWNAQDYEARVFIAVRVTLTFPNGSTKDLTWRFMDSIIPGSLQPGGIGAIKTVGTYVRDTLDTNGNLLPTAQWFEPYDRNNINSPVNNPGVILGNGELVRGSATKNVLRVKRFASGFKSLKEWCVGPRPVVPTYQALTEYIVPGRHLSFTAMPDRIVPLDKTADSTTYLVYGLDPKTSKYSWQELAWPGGPIYDDLVNNKFGIKAPVTITPRKNMWAFPLGLSTCINDGADGVVSNALVFNRYNGYSGYQTYSFVNGALTLTNKVNLSPASLLSIQGRANDVLARAAATNPDPRLVGLREVQVQVYVLAYNKAVYVVSDGLGYVEAGIASYTIANGVLVLDFKTGATPLTPITPPVTTPYGNDRKSASGDDVAITYSDLVAYRYGVDTFDIAISRVYGDVHGDVSFRVTGLASATPAIGAQSNNPARLYQNVSTIDAVDELFPSFAVHGVGLFTYDQSQDSKFTTTMVNLGNRSLTLDPYDHNTSGWIYIPAGLKLIVAGTGFSLFRGQSIKVNPNGVTYCYLTKSGDTLLAIGSDRVRETSNTEVLFGVATNGVLEMNRNYLVVANHLVSSSRRGSAVPYFEDDGALGPNKFFTQRDRI